MSTSEAADANEILASLKLVRSTDPADRRRGILALGDMIDDPRVQQVCEHLYRSDPDPTVREAAWQVLTRQISSIPRPGPRTEAAAPRPKAQPSRVRPAASSRRTPFLLNPKNAALATKELQRTRRRPPRARGWWWLAGLLLLAVGLAWGWVLPDWVRYFRLEQNGVSTTGEVIAREAQGAGDDVRYIIRYRFPVESGAREAVDYTAEQPLTERAYVLLEEAETVPVTYVDGAPDISRVDDAANPDNRTRDKISVIAGGLTVLWLLAMITAFAVGRAARRARTSRLRRGQVVACSGTTNSAGDFEIALRYRFRSLKGQMITVDTRKVRNDLDAESLPQPGTPVLVYHRGNKTYHVL